MYRNCFGEISHLDTIFLNAMFFQSNFCTFVDFFDSDSIIFWRLGDSEKERLLTSENWIEKRGKV